MTKIMMYTLSYCPWCKKTKKFFSDRNISYDFVDYDLVSDEEQDKIAEEIKRSSGTVTFPFVKIGDKVVVGYRPDTYKEMLGLKE